MIVRKFLLAVSLLQVLSVSLLAARIKDIADVMELRENPLSGMGLVVGLPQTGDKSPATLKALRNLLRWHQFQVSPTDLADGNVALVMVTTQLPPLARKGSKIDVTVSTVGDAANLSGGVLLATFLKALNGKTYAVAQGVLSNDGVATVATVSGGAVVEREVPISLSQKKLLHLRLKSPDFNTAERICHSVNKRFKDSSRAIDLGVVEIKVPKSYIAQNTVAHFIAEVYQLQVNPDTPARVVINERTGTVIAGAKVTISPVTIAHRTIKVQIRAEQGKEVTVEQLANSLFALGATASELIAIFRLLKRAGALHAELVIT